MEINTSDPNEAYKYWTGVNPTDDIKILNGHYWQSPHWSREYIMYLKLKPTEEWWEKFIDVNHLTVNQSQWSQPNGAPAWFNPSDNSIKYGGGLEFDQGSRYFIDTLTRECYIYEIQL